MVIKSMAHGFRKIALTLGLDDTAQLKRLS